VTPISIFLFYRIANPILSMVRDALWNILCLQLEIKLNCNQYLRGDIFFIHYSNRRAGKDKD